VASRIAPDQTPRGWAPTARDAVVACAPMTSLISALGLGGTGYLAGRPGIAACGAVVGGAGIYAERLQARQLRQRARRDRDRFRLEAREMSRTVDELRREVAAVREDMEACVEASTAALQMALAELAGRTATPAEPAVPVTVPVAAPPVVPAVVPAAPAAVPAAAAAVPADLPVREPAPVPVQAPATPVPVAARMPWVSPAAAARRSALWVQEARPVAAPFEGTMNTGRIPVLDPGPSNRIAARSSVIADALVYASLAEQEFDAAERELANPQLVGVGAARTGTGGTPSATGLVVVKRGRHVA